MKLLLVLALTLFVGCRGSDVRACYYVEGYGEVCIEYNGKLHLSFDIANDPLKLADVKTKLAAMGVNLK